MTNEKTEVPLETKVGFIMVGLVFFFILSGILLYSLNFELISVKNLDKMCENFYGKNYTWSPKYIPSINKTAYCLYRGGIRYKLK